MNVITAKEIGKLFVVRIECRKCLVINDGVADFQLFYHKRTTFTNAIWAIRHLIICLLYTLEFCYDSWFIDHYI